MTRSRTVEALTPHGSVEYDVVACANCGEEVVPEDAVPVGIGRETYSCDGLPFCRAEHERPRERRALCEYCAAELLDYRAGPDGVRENLTAFASETSALAVGLWLGVVGGVSVGVGALILRALGVL